MSNYYRITSGLNSVGTLIPSTDNPYNHIKEDKDYYLSIYSYNEEQKKLAEEIIQKDGRDRQRGVSGIEDVKTNYLVFDIDNSSDLVKAKEDTGKVLDKLVEKGIDVKNILISFSGNKGFSLVVKHDKELNPQEHKTIALGIAKEAGVEIDSKVYNPSRIFRLNFTKHQETGLYKTPISVGWLKNYSIDFIKKQAEKKPDTINLKMNVQKLPESVFNIKKEIEVKKVDATIIESTQLDFTKKPFYLTDAKYVLHKGHIPKGWGNEGMMILCSTYRNAGFDKTDAYHMLKGVNEKRSEIYNVEKKSNDDIWLQIVNTVYSPLWRGGMYSEKENELLQLIIKEYKIENRDADTKLVSLGDVSSIFKNFAENIDNNTIKIGIEEIDNNYRITTSMLVCLLAPPSAGKTAISLGILETLSNNNIDSLFLSLDMGVPLIYQRLIQRNTGYHADKIFDAYKNKDSGLITKMEKEVINNYKNVSFCFKSGIQIEDIRNMLTDEKKKGKHIKFVAIDYLECLQGPFSDSHANLGFIAQSLKDIANEFDVCILLLVQPQKHAGDPSDEITSYRGIKGNSTTEQAASIIFSISRPGFDPKFPDEDNYLTMNVLKNRMGKLGTHDFYWDGVSGKIRSLDDEGKGHLKSLREAVAKRKSDSKKKDDW